jgi:hypothetical protein
MSASDSKENRRVRTAIRIGDQSRQENQRISAEFCCKIIASEQDDLKNNISRLLLAQSRQANQLKIMCRDCYNSRQSSANSGLRIQFIPSIQPERRAQQGCAACIFRAKLDNPSNLTE